MSWSSNELYLNLKVDVTSLIKHVITLGSLSATNIRHSTSNYIRKSSLKMKSEVIGLPKLPDQPSSWLLVGIRHASCSSNS